MSDSLEPRAMLELLTEQSRLLAEARDEIKALRNDLRSRTLLPSTPVILRQMATEDSARYVAANFPDVMVFLYRHETLDFGVNKSTVDGYFLEFGVATGDTINRISRLRPNQIIYGFDSFVGLPEDWAGTGLVAGRFDRKGNLPVVVKNVRLVPGWFNESLPKWCEQNKGPVSFCHVDSDLYSSAVDIFTVIEDRFVPGTIIVFDDYFGTPNWRNGEHRALQEMIERTGKKYEALAISHQALVIRIT